METIFNYRGATVEVDYDLIQSTEEDMYDEIIINSVLYMDVDIYPIMYINEEEELLKTMYETLFY